MVGSIIAKLVVILWQVLCISQYIMGLVCIFRRLK